MFGSVTSSALLLGPFLAIAYFPGLCFASSADGMADGNVTTPSLPASANTSAGNDCIEVTLPDILGIGKCVRGNLDLCNENKTLVPGLLSLVNCTITGVFQNLSILNAVQALRDIIVAIGNKVHESIGDLLNAILFLIPPSAPDSIGDSTCQGELRMGFPNSLGKCLQNTLKLCSNGKKIDMPILESLIRALSCILTDLLTNQPMEILRQLFCDLSMAASAILGAIPVLKNVAVETLGRYCST